MHGKRTRRRRRRRRAKRVARRRGVETELPPAARAARATPAAPQAPKGLVKVKKNAKTRRISALLEAGPGLEGGGMRGAAADEGDDDDVPLSEMFADAAKVPGRAGGKANKVKPATTGKRDKKTAGTGTGTGTGDGDGDGDEISAREEDAFGGAF